jgi:hypothetical protein
MEAEKPGSGEACLAFCCPLAESETRYALLDAGQPSGLNGPSPQPPPIHHHQAVVLDGEMSRAGFESRANDLPVVRGGEARRRRPKRQSQREGEERGRETQAGSTSCIHVFHTDVTLFYRFVKWQGSNGEPPSLRITRSTGEKYQADRTFGTGT